MRKELKKKPLGQRKNGRKTNVRVLSIVNIPKIVRIFQSKQREPTKRLEKLKNFNWRKLEKLKNCNWKRLGKLKNCNSKRLGKLKNFNWKRLEELKKKLEKKLKWRRTISLLRSN